MKKFFLYALCTALGFAVGRLSTPHSDLLPTAAGERVAPVLPPLPTAAESQDDRQDLRVPVEGGRPGLRGFVND